MLSCSLREHTGATRCGGTTSAKIWTSPRVRFGCIRPWSRRGSSPISDLSRSGTRWSSSTGCRIRMGRLRRSSCEAASTAVRRRMATEADDREHTTFGFAVAHNARPACFVLIGWWMTDVDLGCEYLTSPHEQPHALRPVDGAAIGCLWELDVLAHNVRRGGARSRAAVTVRRTGRPDDRTRGSTDRTLEAPRLETSGDWHRVSRRARARRASPDRRRSPRQCSLRRADGRRRLAPTVQARHAPARHGDPGRLRRAGP